MKRLISLSLVFILLLSLAGPAAATDGEESIAVTYRSIKISLNGQIITPCDESGNTVEPFIADATSSIYLPVRAVAQAMGLDVKWDGATSTVYLTSGGTVKTGEGEPIDRYSQETADIRYRNIKVYLDGKLLELKNEKGETVEPFILKSNGSVYLPIRAVGEAFGLKVGWDAISSTAILLGNNGVGTWLPSKVTQISDSYMAGVVDQTFTISEEYAYDSRGRLIGRYYLDQDSQEWLAEEYEYHDDDSLKNYAYLDCYGYTAIESYNEAGDELLYSDLDPYGYGNIRQSEYDSQGRIIKFTDITVHQNGRDETVTTYRYEGNRCYEIFNAQSDNPTYYTIDHSYDADGNLIKTVRSWDDAKAWDEDRFDSRGNLIYQGSHRSDGGWSYKEYAYDAMGNETYYAEWSSAQGLTDQRSTVYNDFGLPLAEFQYKGSDYYVNTSYDYDNAGKLVRKSVTGSGGLDTWEEYYYDSLGRCTGEKHSNGYNASYTYDANGNPVSETLINEFGDITTVSYSCDSYNNIVSIKMSEKALDVNGIQQPAQDITQNYEYVFIPGLQ